VFCDQHTSRYDTAQIHERYVWWEIKKYINNGACLGSATTAKLNCTNDDYYDDNHSVLYEMKDRQHSTYNPLTLLIKYIIKMVRY
jgi:hypothetical protein